jgi:hypothetical protein
VYTPDDTAVQTPNSDTPYSMVGADLRAEPLVLTVPPIEPSRYFSVQFIDFYTFNFAYAGSRTTGHDGGSMLLAGPEWKGKAPSGLIAAFQCETRLALLVYRTQLFSPADIEHVKTIQAGYTIQTLSSFLEEAAPPPAPDIEFIKPVRADERDSLEFFNVLNFVLQFCPTHPSEQALLSRFHRIGVGPGVIFDAGAFPPEVRRAVEDGVADAWKAFADFKRYDIDTGKVTSRESFGTRAFLKKHYLTRMAAAVLGIYGNSKAEAIYPTFFLDADGNALNSATGRYVLRFGRGELPPVNAFWSLTLYELPSRLLSRNRLNRCVINSSMLPELKRDADGGLTLHIQHDSPGDDLETNWLPAPRGPFFCALRLYWPRPEALDGPWRRPPMQRVG